MANRFSSSPGTVLCAAVALMAATIPVFSATAQPTYRLSSASEVPSFDLWCLQIQRYPTSRCDAHTSGDTQDYNHYRAQAEQFAQTRAEHEEHERELMNRLDRDPLSKPGEEMP